MADDFDNPASDTKRTAQARSSGGAVKAAGGIGAVVLALLAGLAKYADDIGRGALRHADDLGRGASRFADDVGRGASHFADDLGRGATRFGDDLGRSARFGSELDQAARFGDDVSGKFPRIGKSHVPRAPNADVNAPIDSGVETFSGTARRIGGRAVLHGGREAIRQSEERRDVRKDGQ